MSTGTPTPGKFSPFAANRIVNDTLDALHLLAMWRAGAADGVEPPPEPPRPFPALERARVAFIVQAHTLIGWPPDDADRRFEDLGAAVAAAVGTETGMVNLQLARARERFVRDYSPRSDPVTDEEIRNAAIRRNLDALAMAIPPVFTALNRLNRVASVLAHKLGEDPTPPARLTAEEGACLVALLDMRAVPDGKQQSAPKVAERAKALFKHKGIIVGDGRDAVRRPLERLEEIGLAEVVGKGPGSGYRLTDRGVTEARKRRDWG